MAGLPDDIPDYTVHGNCASGVESLEARHGARLRPSGLLRLEVRAGQLEVKTGRGFLEHPGQDRGQDG